LQDVTPIGKISPVLAEYDLLAEHDLYWQNIISTGRICLPLAEHDLYWLIVTLAGRI